MEEDEAGSSGIESDEWEHGRHRQSRTGEEKILRQKEKNKEQISLNTNTGVGLATHCTIRVDSTIWQ